ncbi:glycosyltransferase [Psychroflexus montanilacus]|uniref:glycosyltransferase n=1 Tax=Psychroflexus montanilacus TaxID=2873598 RepID=UPI001CCB0B28|nr:glycosyltransferase [Psychroflexus montanilacus]MBZ9652099.1 glycosyltransferase [Psychroflexus montanilacus]
MKKLKILYTIPNFDTAGSGKVVYDLVKGLDKERFTPEILVKHTRGAFFKEVEQLGVPIHVFDYETGYKPIWSFPFRLLKVVWFFKQHDWDIVHSWHWSSDFSEPLAVRLAGKKFVYTKKAMGWGNKAWVWRSKLSHQVIAINKDMMTEFFNPIPSVKATYLPLGLDTDFYSPRDYHQPTAVMNGISKTDFVVISVVNMVEVKGIEILIEAVIQSQIPNIKLLLVGNDQTDYVKALKDKYLPEYSNITFTGKQQEVQNFLSIADVFVIPTKNEGKREGMPIAPVEAMSMGVPVIGSKVSGITDILEGFEDWLFEASNVKDLTELLHKAQQLSTNELKTIGGQMRQNVIEKYAFETFINSREVVYESI